MRSRVLLFAAVVCYLLSAPTLTAGEVLSQQERSEVLRLLDRAMMLNAQSELVAKGSKIFPVLLGQSIEPNVSNTRLAVIFGVVARIPGDRRQFVELAAKQLDKKDIELSDLCASIYLIREAKAWNYAPRIAKLLGCDDFLNVEVARALAVMGTEKELRVMENWLNKDNRPDDDVFKRRIKEQTQKLRDRLARENKG